MELVTRQYERPGHQQSLLQTFTEDIFIFSLLVYIAHKAFWTMRSTNLLTYLLTNMPKVGMGWKWGGKSIRDSGNGNGYFFTCAKIPIGRLDANAIQ